MLIKKYPLHNKRWIDRNLLTRCVTLASHTTDDIKLRKRKLVPTSVKEEFVVPISVADIHLRHEQLPFAYFFNDEICFEQLQHSFANVLQSFPTTGGTLDNYQCC